MTVELRHGHLDRCPACCIRLLADGVQERVQVKARRGEFDTLEEIGRRYTETLQVRAQRTGHDRNEVWDAGRELESLV